MNTWELCEQKLQNFKSRFAEELKHFDVDGITLDNILWARCYIACYLPEKPDFEAFAKVADIFDDTHVAKARELYGALSKERREMFDRYLAFFWENLH